jgi:N-acyl-D-aspartate/D-glutamate deacylase
VSFAGGFVLDTIPGWEEAMLLPLDQKVELFSSPVARKQLRDRAEGVPRESSIRALVDWSNNVVFDVVTTENEEFRGRRVGDIASEQGRDAWDVLCDIALADGLRTSFGMNPPHESRADWEARAEFVRDPRTVIGASDAGAHLDMVATFNYTTVILDHLVRRERLITLEEAVRLLTLVPAQLYGLRDRGQVAVGSYADLVVLDPSTVGSDEPAMRFDLPQGAGRLYAEAKGIHHVVVNGTPVVSDGELTRARAGTLLRAGRDTFTPALD